MLECDQGTTIVTERQPGLIRVLQLDYHAQPTNTCLLPSSDKSLTRRSVFNHVLCLIGRRMRSLSTGQH